MITYTIASRIDSAIVLFGCEVPDGTSPSTATRYALKKAVAAGADLRDANLIGASLSYARLIAGNTP